MLGQILALHQASTVCGMQYGLATWISEVALSSADVVSILPQQHPCEDQQQSRYSLPSRLHRQPSHASKAHCLFHIHLTTDGMRRKLTNAIPRNQHWCYAVHPRLST